MTEAVRVRDGDVILIRSDAAAESESFDEMAAEFHAKFPTSLVVVLGTEDSLETQELETLEAMLRDIIEHKKNL